MRLLVSAAILTVGVASMAWSQAAQTGRRSPIPANFTGKVTRHPTTDIRMLRYSFEAGRAHQLAQPRGRAGHLHRAGAHVYQERGGAVREFGPRETLVVEPGVVHWHGALPGGPLTQVALSYGDDHVDGESHRRQYARAGPR